MNGRESTDRELREAEARLREAEDTLRAIRTGEVDAVVVGGSEGNRVYSLTGADHPYRVFVEQMTDGAAVLDRSGRITYANRRLSAMAGVASQRLVGTLATELVAEGEGEGLRSLIARASEGFGYGEFTLGAGRSDQLPVYVALTALSREEGFGIAMVVTDLSEVKMAERSLRTSEERFRSIFFNSPDLILTCTAGGGITLASRPAFGCAAGELVGRMLPEVVCSEYAVDLRSRLRRVAELGAAEEIDVRAPDDRWWELRILPFGGETEQGVLVIASDVTEKRRSAAALRESEDKYRSLFRAMNEGFALHRMIRDTHGRAVDFEYLEVSPSFERVTGLPPSAVEGRLASELFGAEQIPFLATYARVEETGLPEITTGFFSPLSRFYRISAFSPRKGLVAGVIADVSGERAAEERIREQARLLDLASDAIIVRDMRSRIRYWNASAERKYGWTASEAIGQDANDLLYPSEHRGEPAAAIEALLQSGEWSGELHHVSRSGARLVVESRMTLIRDEEGTPRSILSVNTDVTEKRTYEEQLLRAQRLEGLGALAGGIAHDLNNVLTPILAGVEILRSGERDETTQTLVDFIRSSAERGAAIVQQVLNFARGAKGERIDLQLRHVVKEIEMIVRETFPKSVELQVSLPSSLWLVRGDPTGLQQVLMNIVINARDAMPDGGRLTLRGENIDFGGAFAREHPGTRPVPYVKLTIEDTGTGIPAGVRDKIFDPFFTTKPPDKGSGLGLSISQSIVKGHGGFIEVASVEGKGSRFSIFLPASEESPWADRDHGGEGEPDARGKGELILLVDDEPAIREVTRRILASSGYRVIACASGSEALEVYGRERDSVAVSIVDMVMPIMDGAATIRAIRALNPAARIISASGLMTEGAEELAQLRVDAFLLKPYTSSALIQMLLDVVDRREGSTLER